MKFKVGDKVRVRKDLKEYEEYGNETFMVEMKEFKGKEVTIDGVYKNRYSIKEDNNKWNYTDEMLEKVGYTYKDLEKAPIGTKVTFENGKVLVKDDKDLFENGSYVRNILELYNFKSRILGKIIKIEKPKYTTVYESKVEILDEVEKKYLRNIIRPFRDKVKAISLITSGGKGYCCINIKLKDENIYLPNFEINTMYKGMKPEKKYGLEELGI